VKRLAYKDRFRIPLNGDDGMQFFSKKGLLLAKGYVRIVIGGRGPYIEFKSSQIVHDNVYVPEYAKYKLENSFAYYHEYRSKDKSNVKLYYQKIGVQYADYKVGMWYIDPLCLKTEEFNELLLPLYSDSCEPEQRKEERTLFDD
jgi:hypothetical protein